MALRPFSSTLSRVCKALDVTYREALIRKAVEWSAQKATGAAIIRTPDSTKDLGQSQAFAVFLPRWGKYTDLQWSASNLATARLFESAAAAQKAIRSRRLQGAVVVEIDLRLRSITKSQDEKPVDLGPLSEAVASIQRQHIEDALQQADVAALRRRLSELEGSPLEPVARRSKM